MKYDHFTDDKIDDIRGGRLCLTADERAFLLEDASRFEECSYDDAELAAMSDADLMSAAFSVWVDYTRSMC